MHGHGDTLSGLRLRMPAVIQPNVQGEQAGVLGVNQLTDQLLTVLHSVQHGHIDAPLAAEVDQDTQLRTCDLVPGVVCQTLNTVVHIVVAVCAPRTGGEDLDLVDGVLDQGAHDLVVSSSGNQNQIILEVVFYVEVHCGVHIVLLTLQHVVVGVVVLLPVVALGGLGAAEGGQTAFPHIPLNLLVGVIHIALDAQNVLESLDSSAHAVDDGHAVLLSQLSLDLSDLSLVHQVFHNTGLVDLAEAGVIGDVGLIVSDDLFSGLVQLHSIDQIDLAADLGSQSLSDLFVVDAIPAVDRDVDSTGLDLSGQGVQDFVPAKDNAVFVLCRNNNFVVCIFNGFIYRH